MGSSDASRRSLGADKLRRTVLTGSARRVSGLVSPYLSQVARRSLQGADTSPYRDTHASMETENQPTLSPRPSVVDMFDPIAPLSSPVTKTYSKVGTSSATKQRQMDAFDQMVVGTSPKINSSYLQPSTPMVNFTDSVELISFDSPHEPADLVQPDSPVTGCSEPKTPATKSKIPVKTPARRSIRGKTPNEV